MAKPFDAATRQLTQTRPQDWVAFLGLPPGVITLLDSDLSSVSLAADRLARVEQGDGIPAYILHLEFKSGKDTSQMPFRLLQYNVNAKAKFKATVVSTVFLLHRGADSPQITGLYEERGPGGQVQTYFRYRAVRVWREDVESLLTGGLSLLPLAPLARVTPADLPGVIARMETRIEAEAPDANEAGNLWTAAYILMGLRYNDVFNQQLLQGVRRMKESVTYQAILEEGRREGVDKGRVEGRVEGRDEGRVEEARRLVLRAGTKRLGMPPVHAETMLEQVNALEDLETFFDRVFAVETWDELIAGRA